MSWEAVAWANRQRLKLPLEQFVLLMLANCADPDGIAFAKWPGKDHWWTYLADRTRMSKGSVFRHLKTIEELGLCARSQMILADGTKRPIVQLDMTKVVDKSAEDDEEAVDQSNDETGDDAAQSHHETDSEKPQSNGDTEASPTVRLAQSNGETGAFIGSKKDSNPPIPPTGGGQVIDQELEEDITEARGVYPIPITNLPKFRVVFGLHPRPKRKLILTAMRGYTSFLRDCEAKRKPRAAKDADRWVASGQWEGYITAGERSEAAATRVMMPVGSRDGKAWEGLHAAARLGQPFASSSGYLLPRKLEPAELAFAEIPPRERWLFIPAEAFNQVRAWNDFIDRALNGRSRPRLVDHVLGKGNGFLAPWPYPPSKEGKIYSSSSTGPPKESLMTQEDEDHLARTGTL